MIIQQFPENILYFISKKIFPEKGNIVLDLLFCLRLVHSVSFFDFLDDARELTVLVHIIHVKVQNFVFRDFVILENPIQDIIIISIMEGQVVELVLFDVPASFSDVVEKLVGTSHKDDLDVKIRYVPQMFVGDCVSQRYFISGHVSFKPQKLGEYKV